MAGVDRCNSPKSLVSGSNESTGPFNFILQQRIDEPAIGKAINLYWVPNTPNFVYIDAAWIVWIMQKQCLHCTQLTLDNTHGLISRPSRTTFSLKCSRRFQTSQKCEFTSLSSGVTFSNHHHASTSQLICTVFASEQAYCYSCFLDSLLVG